MGAVTSLVTFEQFEQLPDAPGKRELIDGELIELPPPKADHSVVARRFFKLLMMALDESRIWLEAGYRIGGGWLQPDISISWPDQPIENGYLSGCPMIAIEVLSPANTAAHIDRKLTLYLEGNCEEVWLADPESRTLTVYRKSEAGTLRIPVAGEYHSAAGITIQLSSIFDTAESA
jgi:Uma2 family endonuclease